MLRAKAEKKEDSSKPSDGPQKEESEKDRLKKGSYDASAPIHYGSEFQVAEMDSLTRSVDLHGLNQEDAWDKTREFLEEQHALGETAVKIIHGYGTGALRAMLEKKLKILKFVKSFRDSRAVGEKAAVVIVLSHS